MDSGTLSRRNSPVASSMTIDSNRTPTASTDNFAGPVGDTLDIQLRQQQLDMLNDHIKSRDAAELSLRRQLQDDKRSEKMLKEECAACLGTASLRSSTADSLQKLQTDLASKEDGRLQKKQELETMMKERVQQMINVNNMALQLKALRAEVSAQRTARQPELVDLKMLEATQNSTGTETYVDLGVESPLPRKSARKISFLVEDQDESTISQIQSQGLKASPPWHQAESSGDGRSFLTAESPQSEDFEFDRQPSTDEEKDDCPETPVISALPSEFEMIHQQADIEGTRRACFEESQGSGVRHAVKMGSEDLRPYRSPRNSF